MKIIINIIALIFIFLFYSLYSFASNDTLKTDYDKNNSEDSIKTSVRDSIIFFSPIKIHGSISNKKINPYFSISKDSVLFTDYTSLQDIFTEKLLIYPLNLGSYSNLNSFSMHGGFPNGLSFRFNGRILSDIQYPFFNYETFPAEYFENIEIFSGSDAIIFSENSSTSLINFQEKIFNTSKPYTKIWFSQAAYDFLASDGTFSQNFIPNVNFTFGFRRMSVKGRFDNTWMDSWNLRGGLRWNIDDKTNISFVDIFTNHGQGTNGGIEKANSQDIFDELTANARYQQLNERLFRHDITLTLTSLLNRNNTDSIKNSNNRDIDHYLQNTRYLTDDIFTASVYFSHSEWNQKRQEELLLNESDSAFFTKTYSFFLGLISSLDISLSKLMLFKAGIEASYLKMDKGIYFSAQDNLKWAVYGHFLTFPFSENLTISGGIRTGVNNNYYFLNAGTKFKYTFNEKTNLLIDFAKYDRTPTPSEGSDLSKETGILIIGTINIKNDKYSIISDIFYRQTKSPIISRPQFKENIIQDLTFINEDDLTCYGLSLSIKFSLLNNLHSKINIIAQKSFLNSMEMDIFPLFYPVFDTYYEISRGRSYVRLGLNASIIPTHKGMNFNPLRRSYIFYDNLSENEQESTPFFFDGLNIYGKARLGTVYVNISLQNILSTNYYFIKYYPMFDRNLRISLHWAFDD